MIVSKETLLKAALPEETVEIPGVGPVRIRGLSRAEWMTLRELDKVAWEVGLLTAGLVDPALTDDEVRQWRDGTSVKLIDDVASSILRLSGMLPDSATEARRRFPETPGDEIRVLPGREAEDDGGQAASGDVAG